VRLIAAEDTRVTRKLLTRFDIHTPLTSYYEHNKLTKLDSILAALAQGDVALVSDAGTPAINDPGYELVKAAINAGYRISPVPGPSAPLAALAVSGLPTDAFLYLGYLPRKTSERREILRKVANQRYTLIFLESPHRLLAALSDIQSTLGDRSIVVARELTKVHEEIWRGSITDAIEQFTKSGPRGEFTLVVEGMEEEPPNWTEDQVMIAIKNGVKLRESPSSLAKRLAEESGWSRKEVYTIITGNKKK
jgi:16S rRNA (cytidine1402-2'-O)-methyltransferase